MKPSQSSPNGGRFDRRTFGKLAGAAALGTLTATAGCTDGLTAALGASLDVTEVTASIASFGSVDVVPTVANGGTSDATAILWGRVSIGPRSVEDHQEITIPAGESHTFDFEFNLGSELSKDDLRYDAWIE